MTSITLTIPEETERRLREKAIQRGQSLEAFLQGLAEQAAGTNGPTNPTEGESPPTAPERKPLAGRLAHLNLRTPSLEEFEEARREMWANFPREFPDPTE